MLTGREETLLACLLMGGKGCMTATSGILPEIMAGIYRAWQEGNLEEARRLQVSILNPVRAMFALPFPVGFKLALETRGFEMGPPKQPLSDAHRFNYLTVKSRIQKVMRPVLAELEKAKVSRTA
jgi:N-acetylneuraminate lyase/4-hydroxy-tetrahydrodipicolinate synthase